MNNLKVMTILGTRPEIIRLSIILQTLDKYVDHVIIHTGQNYDYELNGVFYRDLELRQPDIYLDIEPGTFSTFVGNMFLKIESILNKEKPDAILILGDTNSALCAYIAKRMKIPVYHMEAGNRSYDFNVPEEINRKVVDHVSDINLVYTEHARRNLLREGISEKYIYVTGSPMYEVISKYQDKINNSTILNTMSLQKDNYFLVSIHREENVDNLLNLEKIINILEKIHDIYGVPVIVSTHPRTKKRLNSIKKIDRNKDIRFMKPFGYTDYNKLQVDSKCVISDSGTVSEESSILRFPAITIRNSMERPEAMDSGAIIITGMDSDSVLNSIELLINERQRSGMNYYESPKEYSVNNTSMRVLKIIVGTNKLIRKWYNID